MPLLHRYAQNALAIVTIVWLCAITCMHMEDLCDNIPYKYTDIVASRVKEL